MSSAVGGPFSPPLVNFLVHAACAFFCSYIGPCCTSLHFINYICASSNFNCEESPGDSFLFLRFHESVHECMQSEYFHLNTQGPKDHSGLMLPLHDNRCLVQLGLAYECMQSEHFHLNTQDSKDHTG